MLRVKTLLYGSLDVYIYNTGKWFSSAILIHKYMLAVLFNF